MRADGVTIPLFHNDQGRNGYWVPDSSPVDKVVKGPNDLYAFDGYPGGTCTVTGKVDARIACARLGFLRPRRREGRGLGFA